MLNNNTNDVLINEIEIAFANVKLEDGVSWREADVIDDHGSEEERKKQENKTNMMIGKKFLFL